MTINFLGIGDWGLGIGDWGLGPIPNPQSPIPNPQSPIKIQKNNIKIEKHRGVQGTGTTSNPAFSSPRASASAGDPGEKSSATTAAEAESARAWYTMPSSGGHAAAAMPSSVRPCPARRKAAGHIPHRSTGAGCTSRPARAGAMPQPGSGQTPRKH